MSLKEMLDVFYEKIMDTRRHFVTAVNMSDLNPARKYAFIIKTLICCYEKLLEADGHDDIDTEFDIAELDSMVNVITKWEDNNNE